MTKRCDICGLAINVYEGHYMNVYEDPWQMKAYHSACYREHLTEEFRMASVPLQKGAEEMAAMLQKYFMTLKYSSNTACKLCGLILWPSDSPWAHLKTFALEKGSIFPEKIVNLHTEAYQNVLSAEAATVKKKADLFSYEVKP